MKFIGSVGCGMVEMVYDIMWCSEETLHSAGVFWWEQFDGYDHDHNHEHLRSNPHRRSDHVMKDSNRCIAFVRHKRMPYQQRRRVAKPSLGFKQCRKEKDLAANVFVLLVVRHAAITPSYMMPPSENKEDGSWKSKREREREVITNQYVSDSSELALNLSPDARSYALALPFCNLVSPDSTETLQTRLNLRNA